MEILGQENLRYKSVIEFLILLLRVFATALSVIFHTDIS